MIINKFDKCKQRAENRQNDSVTVGTVTVVTLAATALTIIVTYLLLKHIMISLQNFMPVDHKLKHKAVRET